LENIQSENKLKSLKTLFALLIDISFFPQALVGAWLFYSFAFDSVVLIKIHLQVAYFLVFSEIIVFAIFTAFKKFYWSRFVLFVVYVQFIITTFVTGLSRPLMLFGRFRWFDAVPSDYVFYIFSGFGIIMTVINLIAFHGYKKVTEMEKNDE